MVSTKNWTYGCEHELGDWDTRKDWLGNGVDPEPNLMNSNGVAPDPKRVLYPFGGEINTPPTKTPEEQVDILAKFLKYHKKATANYRTGLHVHIRIPGLIDNLELLKKLQKFICENTSIYRLVDKMPEPTYEEFPKEEDYQMARKRWNWMKMSHWSVTPKNRVEAQLKAKTPKQFLDEEVPVSRGTRFWFSQPRAAINLRQLIQTDTIEFRHFTQSLDGDEVLTAIEWCRDYLLVALDNGNVTKLYNNSYRNRRFPTLADYPFDPVLEERWSSTTPLKNDAETIKKNIKKIVAKTSKTHPWLIP